VGDEGRAFANLTSSLPQGKGKRTARRKRGDGVHHNHNPLPQAKKASAFDVLTLNHQERGVPEKSGKEKRENLLGKLEEALPRNTSKSRKIT